MAFKENFIAFQIQVKGLSLHSEDKTCPQATGPLQFAVGKYCWDFEMVVLYVEGKQEKHEKEFM